MNRQTASQTHREAPTASLLATGILQRKCDCGNHTVAGGECNACNKERAPTLQRSAISLEPLNRRDNAVPPIVHEVLNSPGQPLDAATRSFFESRFSHDFSRVRLRTGEVGYAQHLTVNLPGDQFEKEAETEAGAVMRRPAADRPQSSESREGLDFSQVRIHSDAGAAKAAQLLRARAYTMGHHIVFGAGQYAPATHEGRSVLAHELTHVIQQGQSLPTPGIQRFDWGPWGLGGKCCNPSPVDEWALVGNGTWASLPSGQCTGDSTDCDGMTCGGGFYYVGGLELGTCRTPRQDSAKAGKRRWTPTHAGSDAQSPGSRNAPGNVPPGYVYDP